MECLTRVQKDLEFEGVEIAAERPETLVDGRLEHIGIWIVHILGAVIKSLSETQSWTNTVPVVVIVPVADLPPPIL